MKSFEPTRLGALPWPGPALPSPALPRPANAFTRIGLVFLIPFLFFLFSRTLDITVPQLHLPLVFGSAALAAALLEGSLREVLRFSTTRWLVVFSMWFGVSTVTSVWKGGSFSVFRNYWLKSFIIFLTLACLIPGLQRIRWALRTMILSVSTSAVVGLLLNSLDREGRLRLPAGELTNSNGFGVIMVLGLSLCWYAAAHPVMSKLWRIAGTLLSLPIIYAAARTGSRTAFVAFALTFFFVFFHLPLAKKVWLAFLSIPVLIGLLAVIPDYIEERLSTILVIDTDTLDESASELEESAVASAQTRRYLLERSLIVTFQNPVFGVGPGNFMVAEDELAKRENRPGGLWRVTHNGFTEVSSEMGLPGLIMYCAAILSAWRALRRFSRLAPSGPQTPEIRHTASSLQAALFCMALAMFFGVGSYSYYMPALLGLSVAFTRWANAALAASGPLEAASREPSGAGGLRARTADLRRPWPRG